MNDAMGLNDTKSHPMGPYLNPMEAAQASADETDKALGAVISFLYALYQEKRKLRYMLQRTEDDEEIGEMEYELKQIRGEESSLHRLESGLQSRLKVGGV